MKGGAGLIGGLSPPSHHPSLICDHLRPQSSTPLPFHLPHSGPFLTTPCTREFRLPPSIPIKLTSSAPVVEGFGANPSNDNDTRKSD